MTLVAMCSLKGSPGVTTAALGLAGQWPSGHQPVVMECDPAGGDLLARYRLAISPGLVTLAAAGRRSTEPGLVWQHTQRLPGGLRVVPGPPSAGQAQAALEQLTSEETTMPRRAADRAGVVVIADCGRVEESSPALPVLRQADALLVLVRARDDALAHLATMVNTVERWSAEPCFVLVGDGYRTDDVVRELGIEVAARLPEDKKGAAALSGALGRRAAPARSALGKALASLADNLADRSARTRRRGVGTLEATGPNEYISLPWAGSPVVAASSPDGSAS
ncbi:MinD/ParA family protein [Streptomyces sp. NPDC050658]|uniref:MinD/ParA family ATP-binding protein n=1 Tax=unclassified Streptomyces TaxID=2593676 RepID=UPI003434E149